MTGSNFQYLAAHQYYMHQFLDQIKARAGRCPCYMPLQAETQRHSLLVVARRQHGLFGLPHNEATGAVLHLTASPDEILDQGAL